jgi:acetylornithine deacetylase
MPVPVSPALHTVEWLRRLIGYQTISGSDSNTELIEFAAEALQAAGFTARFTRSPDGLRMNLLASRGEGPGGLLLSGHTDVVPVTGQKWTRPPFELTEDEDRFYGRGTCDMKGFIACVLAVVQRSTVHIKQPLHVALTYDEEIGCIGVRSLLADLAQAGIRPAACIVGEPTGMRVVRAHKGRHAYRFRIVGQAAHSSLSGIGVNAAEIAGSLVTELTQNAAVIRQGERDEGFYIPYSTIATCRISAGQASNVIPEEAEVDFDLRYLPGADPELLMKRIREAATSLEEAMRTHVSSSEITLTRRTAVPPLASSPDGETVAQAALSAGAHSGTPAVYTTEGGLYQAAGVPTIICGPGDIAQAHTSDEFILKSEFAACETFLEKLITQGLPSFNAE